MTQHQRTITPRMVNLATQAIPTVLRMVRESRDPNLPFQAKRILALLPPEAWGRVLSELQTLLGATLDREALEQAVIEAKQTLRAQFRCEEGTI
jgi:hypothetical protein